MDITEKMERAFAELPGVRVGPYYSRTHNEYNRADFLRSIIPTNVLNALHRAREAQELAVSYRGFNVGAAAVALTGRNAGFQILPGINAKTNEDGPLNMHAEQLALRTASTLGADMISIVAVVGETQADQQSGHEMHTLHPCGKCRAKLAENPMIDNDATLIFSALPDLRTIEVGTVNSLLAYHEDDDPDQSGMTLFELPDMDLLKPFVPPESGAIYIEDTPRTVEEERMWVASIGRYVIEHQLRLQGYYQLEA
jgi:cytidine deaminase